MNFLVIPDSFKGALDAGEAAEAITRGLRRAAPEAEITAIPLADGGEGTVAAMLAARSAPSAGRPRAVQAANAKQATQGREFPRSITCTVCGPRGQDVQARYALLDEHTAVIEMAAAAGLPLMGEHLDVEAASTYGVGQLVAHARGQGVQNILVGAGGSASNDLGCGAAAALGAVFRDDAGEEFIPTGADLHRVASVDASAIRDALGPATITVLADIDNPVLGDRGCAVVFAPQKGADGPCVARLEAGAQHLTGILERDCGVDVASLPGAGAAGGFAGGLVAMCGAVVAPGIDALLDAIGFEDALGEVDAIITAEGQIDGQSLAGKVPVGIARRAGGTPVFVLAGSVGEAGASDGMAALYEAGITAVFPIGRRPEPLPQAMAHTAGNLEAAAENLARVLAAQHLHQKTD